MKSAMGRKTKRGNLSNAAQAASTEAPWVALPRKDKTQPTSSSTTGSVEAYPRRGGAVQGRTRLEGKEVGLEKALEFSPPVAVWSRHHWTAGVRTGMHRRRPKHRIRAVGRAQYCGEKRMMVSTKAIDPKISSEKVHGARKVAIGIY
jgi:hypothetical protein